MASRSLGTLTLDLVTKIAGFTGPLDKAERELDKRTKRMNRMASDFGKTLGIGLAAGFGVATTAMGIYIRNTIEAEKVQSQLAARIRDTGGAAGKSIGDLNKVSAALQNLTTFDDESIGRVQAMLLTFRNIKGDAFDDATKAVLNLSTAMGTDLNSAALQVGKALNDPAQGIAALSRAGVQFSEDQKKVIKSMVETGNVAGAQKIILKELEGEMGTAAEAARNTLGGALEALKNSFDNLLEGDSGDAGVKGARAAIEALNATLNDPDIKSGVQTIITGMANIARAAANAIPDIVAFNQRLEEAFGISASGPTRNANVADFFSGEAAGIKALLSGDFEAARAAAKRARAGFSGGTVANFTNVKGVINGNAPDFSNVSGLVDGGRGLGATGGSGGGGKNGGGSRRIKQSADDAAEALKRLTQAQDDWHSHVLDMVADLSGPAAQAERDYQKALEELNAAYKEGKVRQEDYGEAQKLLLQQRDAELAKIKEQLSPAQELIESMQAELSLIGLTNIEREKAIALRQAGADATDEERQHIAALVDQMASASREADFFNEAQRDLSDALFNTVTGAQSAGDAIKDFFDNLARYITRMISDQWAQKITDLFKNPTGSGGGWGEIISAILGGGSIGVTPGAASGGWRPGNSMFEVNERGFEMASVGGRDYLLTGPAPVHITPNNMLGGSGMSQINNFNYAAPYDPRTAQQTAQRVAFETRRATSRNN